MVRNASQLQCTQRLKLRTKKESQRRSSKFTVNQLDLENCRYKRLRQNFNDLHLNEVDGVSTLMNDEEADEFGPLTEAALEKEQQRSRLDPSYPRRPQRLIPVGQIEKDTPESKAFREFALEG